MLLMRKTSPHDRLELRLSREGVVTRRLRPKAGGGYYVAQREVVPWFWVRVS